MPIYGPPHATLSRFDMFEPPASPVYSSLAPGSTYFVNTVIPNPVAISNINLLKSISVSAPNATSENSSGTLGYSFSHGVSIFTRQDFGANSSNISMIASGSVGLSAGMTYSSSSQSFAMSWVTDSTGGTSSFSTTSGSKNWTSYGTGPKILRVPLVTTLTLGEYFFAHGISSTTATTGSDVTLMSVSGLNMGLTQNSYGVLGNSITESYGAAGNGWGSASAITTNATMPLSVVTTLGMGGLWFNLSNA